MEFLQMKIFISLFMPFLLGVSVTVYLYRKQAIPLYAIAAIGYGIGNGLLAQHMFLIGAFNLPLNKPLIIIPLFIISALFIFFYIKHKPNSQTPISNIHTCLKDFFKTSTRYHIFFAVFYCFAISYIIYIIIYLFWHALKVPIHAWDSIATIAFRAKILFHDKSFIHFQSPPHPYYPLHTPLLQTWISLNLGTWSEQLTKIIFPCTFLSFLTINYFFLKTLTTRTWALTGTFMICASPFLIRIAALATNDFTLIYYNCVAIMLIVLWSKSNRNEHIIAAGMFSGFATFVKLEALIYPVIHFSILLLALFLNKNSILKEKIKNIIRFILPCAIITLPFNIYKWIFSVHGSGRFCLTFPSEFWERILVISSKFAKNLFLMWHWNIIWTLFAICLTCTILGKKMSKEYKLLLAALSMFFCFGIVVGLFTPNYAKIFLSRTGIQNDIPRMIAHFYPIVIWLIILSLSSFYVTQEEKDRISKR